MESIENLRMYLSVIKDKRRYKYKIQHKLVDVLTIVLCGLLCGCESIQKIEMYGKSKKDFFEKNFGIEKIPSSNTIYRMLAIIDYELLDMLIEAWIRTILPKLNKKIISFDGKEIVSTERMQEYEKPLYAITAYLGELGISLRQVFVEGKGNEIKAVQEMIDMINIEGMVVTADANHCQKKTVEKIIDNKGDYVIQLKGNQGNLYRDVKEMFGKESFCNPQKSKKDYNISKEYNKNGNRIETRECYVIKDIKCFTYLNEWKGIKSIFAIRRTVETKGKKSEEYSYYISSLEPEAEKLMYYARKHWMIESMHWLLDTNLNEDKSKIVNKNTQKVFNIMRKLCLSYHKAYIESKSKKKAMSHNMFECLLDDKKLLDVLKFIVTQS